MTPADATSAPPRSMLRAVGDLREGISHRQLWAHLGWQDIKQRYRRSVIGPLWITISMGVTSLGLGLLYGLLFKHPLPLFLPYVTTGFIVWGFINGCIVEGMDTFISNEGLIKHLPAPLTVYALRTVWRQVLMFLHNIAIYLIITAIFFTSLDHPYSLDPGGIMNPGIGLWSISAVLGFVLLAANGLWLTLLFGIISTRYRDIPQVINSLIQLAFYLTPIIWSPDDLFANGKHSGAEIVFQLNPLYHFVQIVRAPLTGQAISPLSWLVVGGITIVGWALALVALRNYRARVSYWV
ncbi:MAG TPA: ABC transporter permease [Pseudonocardiaceae bacterium]|jgi:ABC-2 type transport system permease protein|nr:ABC transporter permease [Pseudonocardiaceae bacterium]